MSTKRKRTILLIAFAQVVSIAACRELCAQSAADDPASQPPARPVIQKPLTREDAELMLREAHGMIEQGRLDEANKLISRVEHAHVQFPFFHLGPTAASLRKELSHAQRLRAASKALSHDQSTGSKRYLPFSRNTGGAASTPSDPFLAHNQNSEHASSTLGASPNGDPATSGHRLATVAAPTTLALDSQAHGRQTIDNPFASAGTSLSLPASKAAGESTMPGSSFDYPLPHLASED
ncbi:MAG TPA: hypothetical protein VHE81_18155, partial [Lacipirellulaceae bacterium]|nr:hypothetical protein [Lacipirellulaceae bacterium]